MRRNTPSIQKNFDEKFDKILHQLRADTEAETLQMSLVNDIEMLKKSVSKIEKQSAEMSSSLARF